MVWGQPPNNGRYAEANASQQDCQQHNQTGYSATIPFAPVAIASPLVLKVQSNEDRRFACLALVTVGVAVNVLEPIANP